MRSRAGKKRRKLLVLAGAGVLLAAAAGSVCFLQYGNMKKGAVLPEAVRVNVGRDTLSTTVVGSGNLQGGETQDIQVPAGLVVQSIAVETGDTVSAGQILATVDETALKVEIAGVQSAISELDDQIQEKSQEVQSENLTSKVAGRIKKIYVESGDSIADVMVEKGALMLLSLDGKMAVQIENESAPAAGSTVSVALSQGTAVSGTVETRLGDGVTVTVDDDGVVLGEEVTVSDSNGQVLGTGVMEIHQALEVTGSSGMVSAVSVEENQWVEAGEDLLTLEEVPVPAQYQKLLLARTAYKERLQKLLALAENCSITAPWDGTIESIGLTEGSTTSASAGNSDADESSSSAGGSSSIPASSMAYNGGYGENAAKMAFDGSESSMAVWENGSDGSAQQDAQENQIQQETQENQTQQEKGENQQPQENTEAQGNARYEINEEALSEAGSQEANQEVPQTGTDVQSQTSLQPGSDASQTFLQADSASQTQTSGQENLAAQDQETSQADKETSNQDGTDSRTDEVQAVQEMASAFSISGQEQMVISIDVDELDILSVQEGQEAQVTLEALEEDVFSGVVTRVSDRTSGSEGSAKYTVEITVDREDSMRVGMSASAVIVTEKKENVITVPSDALQERGHQVFVYTQYDSDSRVLDGIQEVETGMSDGEKVEITSGLEEGDTIYYQKQESSSAGEESQNMPADKMFGGMGQDGGFGGEMPGGNTMPGGAGEAHGEGGGMPGGGNGRMPQ